MQRFIPILLTIATFFSTYGQEMTYTCPPCGQSCDTLTFHEGGICPHCQMMLRPTSEIKTIAFYLQDGVEILDFAGPLEVFSYAGFEVFTVTKQEGPIKSQGVLKIQGDYTLEDAPKADIVALFGGNSNIFFEDTLLVSWLHRQTDSTQFFSVCTGALALAEAGLLDDQSATTFHSTLDHLETNYPKVDVHRNVRFVDNGRIITTAGVSAGIDGALHLVQKLLGYNAARKTAYYMEYEYWQPDNGLILYEEPVRSVYLSKKELHSFAGFYEFTGPEVIELTLDDRGDLWAVIEKNQFPLFHEGKDLFSNINAEPVRFIRDEQDKIIGYKIPDQDRIFRKIK